MTQPQFEPRTRGGYESTGFMRGIAGGAIPFTVPYIKAMDG